MRQLSAIPTLPADRGRLLSAKQVADELLGGHKSARWVRQRMSGPGTGRLKMGHRTVFWYEYPARTWIASHLQQ